MKKIFMMMVVLSTTLMAQEKFVLTESSLAKIISQNPPQLEQLEANLLQVRSRQSFALEKFSLKLQGQGDIQKSRERLLSNFDGGVTQSLSSFSVGLAKKTRYGIDLKLEAFGHKVVNPFISGATTNGLSLGLGIDLYGDFLGKYSRKKLYKNELELKRATVEKEIKTQAFGFQLKKLYWAMVANREESKLLQGMFKLAKKQLKEAKKRYETGVADKGEVARYQSILSGRKSRLLSINYARAELHKRFKELIPQVHTKEIELGSYDPKKIRKEVLACSAFIRSFKEAPLQFTEYDEVIELLKEEGKASEEIIKGDKNITVKLQGELATVGRGFGYEMAQEDFINHGRSKTKLGVFVSIPLGKENQATRKVKKRESQAFYQSQIDLLKAKMNAYHIETLTTINLLKQVIRSQKETHTYLQESLKTSHQKFKQARIGLEALINEEDALLEARYSEIQTNLTILNVLMDYFSIYNSVPCKLNRT